MVKNKPTVYILVGLQGSGKSTQAKILAEEYSTLYGNALGYYDGVGRQSITSFPAVIVSSDQIRKDHPEIADDNNKVFDKYYADINYFLRRGSNVVADATNLTIKSRRQIFERVKEDCYKIAYIMNTPIEICRERLMKRNQDPSAHNVSLDILEQYHKSFQCPFYEEGFDKISLHNDFRNSDGSLNSEVINRVEKEMLSFDQNNPNHQHSLGIHSKMVYDAVNRIDNYPINEELLNMQVGAYLHDVGKLTTRAPNKNNPEYDSYISHENVGAYWKICNGFSVEEAFYECYHHVRPELEGEEFREWLRRKRGYFGEEKISLLVMLREADRNAK